MYSHGVRLLQSDRTRGPHSVLRVTFGPVSDSALTRPNSALRSHSRPNGDRARARHVESSRGRYTRTSARKKCLLRCLVLENQPVDDEQLPMSSAWSYGEALAGILGLPWRQPGAIGRHLLRLALRPIQVGDPVSSELSTS